jgi:hypothetical protein
VRGWFSELSDTVRGSTELADVKRTGLIIGMENR